MKQQEGEWRVSSTTSRNKENGSCLVAEQKPKAGKKGAKKTPGDFPAPGICDPCTLDEKALHELETAPCSPRRSPMGPKCGEFAEAFGCEIDPNHVECDCPICRNLDLSDAPLLL